MKRMFIGLLFLALFLSVLLSCGKRENPVRTIYPFDEPYVLPPPQGEEGEEGGYIALQDNRLGDSPIKWVWVYLPPQYDSERHFALWGRGFPVLYLLHGFRDNYSTFMDVYKVQQIADRLIAEGEIQPMIIVMPDGSNSLGGSFYANSDLIGKYRDYIVNELMLIIDTKFHTVAQKDPETEAIIPDSRYKAISGHGMGGYGAFKMALDYDTTLFGSVSGMSPFLSFKSFLTREVIDSVFRENGIEDDDFSYLSYKTISPVPAEEKPLTSLLFAMAAAFSPHDPSDIGTIMIDTIIVDSDTTVDTTIIDNFFVLLEIAGQKYGVDLPFDSTRAIPFGPGTIWDRWMSNHDIYTLVAPKGGFGGLKIYFDCGDFDQLKLYKGARDFHKLLSQYGIEHTFVEYPGYGDYPAGHSNFIYDRLPEILKFHSRHFPPPTWE